MSKFALIKATYTEDLPLLYGRNLETGQKTSFLIPGFKPHFYVEDSEGSYISVDGIKLKKVEVDRPYDVPEARSKFPKTWQADIPYARNYLICSGIKSGFEVSGTNVSTLDVDDYIPYILYLDVETYPSGNEINEQKDFVTAISIADNKQGSIASLVNGIDARDEKELLTKVARILNQADSDIITSYSDYDYKILNARFKINDINFSFNQVNYFDLLAAVRNLFSKASYSLKNVAYEEGITTEKQPQLDYKKLFDEDKDELRRINTNHTRWIRDLDKKHQICNYFWQLKQYVGLESLENTLYSSVLIDALLLREYHNKYVLPTKEKHERVPYEGAIVLEPKKGIFQGIAVLDMDHFYPAVLESENLSPEIQYGVGKGEGILPQISKRLMLMRNELKGSYPLKYAAIKAIHNSLYGALAAPGFRLFVPEIAAKITEKAREGLKFVIDKVESKNYEIISGDTDSIFVRMNKGDVDELTEWLNSELRSIGDYEIKFEKYFIKFCCLGQKKRYFGQVEGRDRLEVKGFEQVRSDSSKLTKHVQQEIMKFILDNNKEGIVSYLKKIVKEFDSYSYEDIAIPRGLSRNLNEYKNEVDYIRGARWFKDKYKTDMKAGDKIWYIYCRTPIDTITVPDPEMFRKIIDLRINKDRMIERVVVKPTESLISILDLDWQEIRGQGRLL